MKKNECFYTVTGRQLWDGRYNCVCGVVLYYNEVEDKYYVLANRRGDGSEAVDAEGVNNIGKWNMPCGYLDAGSGEENAAREVFEETGVSVNPELFREINHSDLATQRNITFRYLALVDEMYNIGSIEQLVGGEENEVSAIAWIPEDELDNYTWAFNHDSIAREMINYCRTPWC